MVLLTAIVRNKQPLVNNYEGGEIEYLKSPDFRLLVSSFICNRPIQFHGVWSLGKGASTTRHWEAAGAGLAGVADEVRNLAMRAAEAAKNTAGPTEGPSAE